MRRVLTVTVVLAALVSAAISLLLLWQYDKRWALRIYTLDAQKLAQELASELQKGSMSEQDLEKWFQNLKEKIQESAKGRRVVILQKEAVIGGAVEELQP